MQSQILKWFLISQLFVGASCGIPEKKSESKIDIEVLADQAWIKPLKDRMATRFHFQVDSQVKFFLEQLGQQIVNQDPNLQKTKFQVSILKSNSGTFNAMTIPTADLYLSVGILKKLENDSEIAALFSLELGRVLRNHLAAKIDGQKPLATWSEAELEKLFRTGPKEDEEAIEEAVRLLYLAGFDARALPGVLEKLGKSDAQNIETTYTVLSRFPPVRNPKLKTKEFVGIQMRIQKL